jgi:hypothetical protein
LVTVNCLAIKLLYKNYNGQERLKHMIYNIVLSLKRFKSDSDNEILPPDALGYYIGNVSCLIDQIKNIDEESEDFWRDTFWTLSSTENRKLHNLINSEHMFMNLPKLNKDNQMSYHFGFSNIGTMKSSLNNDPNSLLGISRNIFSGNNNPLVRNRFYYGRVVTIDYNCYWTFLYNNFYISEQIIDETFMLIHKNIDKVFKARNLNISL